MLSVCTCNCVAPNSIIICQCSRHQSFAKLTPVYFSPGEYECATDLVFLIDNSNSIIDTNSGELDYTGWELLRDFTMDVVERLTIDPDHVRVGYVTYSSREYHQFYFDSNINQRTVSTLHTCNVWLLG